MIDASFIICTYNAPELIKRCLDSILKQKYKGKIEVLIVDGGSAKETLNVLDNYKKRFKNIKIIHNKRRFPEGYGKGKWLGCKKAKGKFIVIIDQDNELQGENWINEMLKPFLKEDIFGCACRLALKEGDNLTNKYIALQGTDPFLAYKSLDGIINLKKIGEDKEEYLLIEIDKENPIITGGNCFIYRKSYLDKVGGYTQDTENIARLIEKGHNKLAIPKNAFTHHFAVKGFFDFARKKEKWAGVYKNKKNRGSFSYMPKSKIERRKFIINLFFIIGFLPNVFIALKQFVKTKEKAWLLHSILPLITFIIYFIYAFGGKIFGKSKISIPFLRKGL